MEVTRRVNLRDKWQAVTHKPYVDLYGWEDAAPGLHQGEVLAQVPQSQEVGRCEVLWAGAQPDKGQVGEILCFTSRDDHSRAETHDQKGRIRGYEDL